MNDERQMANGKWQTKNQKTRNENVHTHTEPEIVKYMYVCM